MIKDSGARTEFDTGAVRDIQEEKGRRDLLPLKVINNLFTAYKEAIECWPQGGSVLGSIENYKTSGDASFLVDAACYFIYTVYGDPYTASLELAIHFGEGAEKYDDNNWRKGIPVSSYIGSATGHYIKFLRGDTDEHHERAFLWNIVCALWTIENMPHMEDIDFDSFVGGSCV